MRHLGERSAPGLGPVGVPLALTMRPCQLFGIRGTSRAIQSAQSGSRPPAEMPCVQVLMFQLDVATRLKPVDFAGSRRKSTATELTSPGRIRHHTRLHPSGSSCNWCSIRFDCEG